MQDDLTEVRLPAGARARALQRARQFLQDAAGDEDLSQAARETAFANYAPRPLRADRSHAASPPASQRESTGQTVREISAQLQQLDDQRRRLSELLHQMSPDR